MVTLAEIEKKWRDDDRQLRDDLVKSLAGWSVGGEVCPHCDNRHSVGWFEAVCGEPNTEALNEWLSADSGPKAQILAHHVVGRAFKTCLQIATNVRSGAEPQSLQYEPLFSDMAIALATRDGTNNQSMRDLKSECAVIVAFAGGTPRATAGRLRLQWIENGIGCVYPVYCQAFINFSPDFVQATERAFTVIKADTWRNLRKDLRWSIQQRDRVPWKSLQDRSLEGAWALVGANLYAKASATGIVTIAGSEFCEISLDEVAISAKVDDHNGTLEPVECQTIEEKRRAVADWGAKAFVVAKSQEGLKDDAEKRLLTLRCASTQEAFSLLESLQAECVLDWITSRGAAMHLVSWGSVEFVWTAVLITFLSWLLVADSRFLVAPFLWFVFWLACWPFLSRGCKIQGRLPIPADATRTTHAWRHMVKRVGTRIESECKGIPSFLAVSACDWLGETLEVAARNEESNLADEQACQRFPLEGLNGKLIKLLWHATKTGDLATLAGPISTLTFIAILFILASPLQCRLAEFLPPGGNPAIRGVYATVIDSGGERPLAPFAETANAQGRFVGEVGVYGRLHVRADDKPRVRRKLRLHCVSCSCWTETDRSLAPVAALVGGEASFDCWVDPNPGVQSTVSVELLTEWGKQLAFAVVEPKRW